MRIGFTGSQGTGKTTLAKHLVKQPEFKDYTFIPSAARVAEKEGFKVNRDADPLSQLLTTAGRITTEYEQWDITDDTISDRTPLDSLAYTTYQFNNVWPEFNSGYYWKVSYALVEKHMENYDVLVYFPNFWAPTADGVRDGDPQYQADIDVLIKTFLETMDMPHVVMPNATNAERYKIIKSACEL